MEYSKNERAAIARALNIIAEKTGSAASDGETFASPSASGKYFTLRFAEMHDREHFMVAFLDSQHRLLGCDVLFSGTIDGAAVYPREVVKAALRYNATAVVLAHNHPSGVVEPSSADRRITERLCSALGLLDIRTLDHVIVGGTNTYSFAEHGLI